MSNPVPGGTQIGDPANLPPWAGPPYPTRTQRIVIASLTIFLLLFPKGGVKIAEMPITWGYLLLGAVTITVALLHLLGGRYSRVQRSRVIVLAALLPFQAVSLLAFAVNDVQSVGFVASFLVTFFFLPYAFVLILGDHLDRMDLGFLLSLIRRTILLVAAYGLFLFFFKLVTGRFIEIPLLTVNLGDLGELDDKYIDRGGIFKLISTYNNGNIYGICLLMLLPLYTYLEPRISRQGLVKASLILTLSRTVWIGLILHEVVTKIYVRRLTFRSALTLTSLLGALALGISFALDLIGVPIGFLFDAGLGGRASQFLTLDGVGLFSSTGFLGISEIVYLSILANFGILGLAFFLLGMSTPLALFWLRRVRDRDTEYKRSVAAGLFIYLVVAASDGAILFIPVQAFYWFLVSLLLAGSVCPSFSTEAARSWRRRVARSSSEYPARMT